MTSFPMPSPEALLHNPPVCIEVRDVIDAIRLQCLSNHTLPGGLLPAAAIAFLNCGFDHKNYT